MLNRWLPGSIVVQVTALLGGLLAAVLLVVFGVLTAETMPHTTSGHLEEKVGRVVRHAAGAEQYAAGDLPVMLSNRAVEGDTVFLSDYPQAGLIIRTEPLDRWARRLERALTEAGYDPLSVMVVRGHLLPEARPFGGRRGPRGGGPGGRPPPMEQVERQTEIVFSAELAPGLWINSISAFRTNPIAESSVWYVVPPIFLLCVLLIWLYARQALRPVRAIRHAADSLGRGEAIQPIPEDGPREIRDAAGAFNRMQDRLVRSMATQRTIMRAVSHDLRTPLTELRIRAEDIPEEYGREKIVTTIDEMTQMTAETLEWAREASGGEPLAPVDIAALVESIADDFADTGKPVSCSDMNPVVVMCRRVALRRAIRNLIDNAVSYGGQASVSVAVDATHVEICVDDTGPGIPEDLISDVLNPFVRLERSRGKATGGIGLGLSIVQTIAEMHGGTVRLSNRVDGGLSACLILPRTTD